MVMRATLHDLIDELPDEILGQAQSTLLFLRELAERPRAPILENDPLWLAFQDAPEDDEPLTPEDIAAIEEGRAELDRGEGIPWEIVRAQLLDAD